MVTASESSRARALLPAAGRGAAAGLVGVAVMTGVEKLEQSVTHRPNSYIPARTLLTLLQSSTSGTRAQSSVHTLKPVKTEERRPLVSNCWMTCATFASAVGETKLALTAMLKN